MTPRLRASLTGRLCQLVCVAVTFHCVCLAWCFFRLTVLADSLACVRKWFVFTLLGVAVKRQGWVPGAGEVCATHQVRFLSADWIPLMIQGSVLRP